MLIWRLRLRGKEDSLVRWPLIVRIRCLVGSRLPRQRLMRSLWKWLNPL